LSKAELPKATAATGGKSPGTGGKSPGTGGGRPYKRQIRHYLIDRKLQGRYVLFVTLLSAVLAGALGYLIYRQEHMASAEVLATFEGLDQNDEWAELRRQAADRLQQGDNDLVLQMAGVGIGLVVVLSMYLVVMTHKVAGPLFKVSGYFDKMAAGHLGEVYPLRKGDMLIDFYASFQEMHKAVRGRFRDDTAVMARFLTACDDAGVKRDGPLGAELEQLHQHVDHRKSALS
jgi:hypothetical protein